MKGFIKVINTLETTMYLNVKYIESVSTKDGVTELVIYRTMRDNSCIKLQESADVVLKRIKKA